jgi:hypothetical protein
LTILRVKVIISTFLHVYKMNKQIVTTGTELDDFVEWLLQKYCQGCNGGFVDKEFSPYSQGDSPSQLLKKFRSLEKSN